MVMIKVVHLNHSGFVIISQKTAVLIDYYQDTAGVLPILLSETEKVYVLSSHGHQDHFNPEVLSLDCLCDKSKYILSEDIRNMCNELDLITHNNEVHFVREGDCYEDGDLSIKTFGSTDLGVSFLIKYGGKLIFHAGDLNNWHWEKESTIEDVAEAERDFLKVLNELKHDTCRLDLVMFPVDPRMQGDFSRGARQFVEMFDVGVFIPMHTWGMWDQACDFSLYWNNNVEYVCLKDGDCLTLK